MAGIYIHIPFCRKACRYCDFHFNISLGQKKDVVSSIILELERRKDDLGGELIETIYFGGGTPSVLDSEEVTGILKAIFRNHKVDTSAEISFEANPDDLKEDYLRMLKDCGINRLSIGMQSFSNKDLELLRRSHTVDQSINAIGESIRQGFDNINIDLIYGIPGQDNDIWSKNIDIATGINIQHISAYHLTFEPGTIFDHWRKKGKISPVDEDQSLYQLEMIIDKTASAGFEHYEISNFALPGFQSKHNTNYWKQVNYLGIGPSAHTYYGTKRRWNISNNLRYVKALQNNHDNYFEIENLTITDLYNEFILTSLRTKWGINLKEAAERFGDQNVKYAEQAAEKFIRGGELSNNDGIIKITRKGIFLTDYIISEFFRT